MRNLSALLLALVLVSPLAAAAQAESRNRLPESLKDPGRLRLIDVFELEWASDPQISPDGEAIVYVRNFMDVMSDRQRSNLWIVRSDGSDHRPLTTGLGNESSPRWSPDGKRLLYASSGDGRDAGSGAQLYERWMDSGQTARLTQLTSGPGGLTWSPDGRSIAFTMRVGAQHPSFVEVPDKPEGAEWAEKPVVIDKLIYRADGAGYLEDGFEQLFVLSAEGGTPRQLTDGDFDHGGRPSWTPDGEALVFSANRHEDWRYNPMDSEVYEVRVAGGEIRALTDRRGPDRSPAVSPDGRQVAYVGFDDRLQGYQVERLYVVGRDGGEPRMLAADLDRDVDSPVWAKDGKGVFFGTTDRGNGKVGYASLAGGHQILAGDVGGTSLGRPYGSGSFSVAGDGRFAFTHSRPDHPADVAVGRKGDEVRRLTRLNDDLLAHKELGAVEEIWWKSSHDGRDVQGWIVKPPGFDAAAEAGEKYPLVLEIHGGPFADYGDRFAAEIQLYAAAGYVVLYANPRGSTSYGEEFGNLIHHAYPGNDYDDLMSGVDAVIERGYVDPDNLFVTGGSGGGALTAWIVGKTGRFRAAVSAKPVINWYSFVLTSDAYNFFYKYWFPGFPWDHAEHYLARSPLSFVGNVTTPTMLLTGEADYRTPISESEQFYQALKLRKVDSMLVRIPEASHGIIRRPSNLINKVAHILGWFEKYRE
jgi:acylaminoacyl-peptidase